jgi:hypothetical protein
LIPSNPGINYNPYDEWSTRSPEVVLHQQYIHYHHYTSTLDETTRSEKAPVKLHLLLHYRSHSQDDVGVYACGAEKVELSSHLQDGLFELAAA